MIDKEAVDLLRYQVLRNDEGQYGLFPADRQLPTGWSAVGMSGAEDECMAYVEEAWQDMTPASLRSPQLP